MRDIRLSGSDGFGFDRFFHPSQPGIRTSIYVALYSVMFAQPWRPETHIARHGWFVDFPPR